MRRARGAPGDVPFEQQRQVLFFVCDRLPRFTGGQMDATGNGAYLAEVAAQRYGMERVPQVKMSAPWYLENFPPLKDAFEGDMIRIPADAELADDLALVKKVAGIPQIPPVRTTTAEGKKRHGGDADDAAFDAWRGRSGRERDVLFGERTGRLW